MAQVKVIPSITGRLKVMPVTAAPINTRISYFARNLKKVCRVTKIPAGCWEDESMERKLKTKARGTDSDAKKRAACVAVGGHFTAGSYKEARDAKLELDFLSWQQAARLKTRPGPVLRLCGESLTPGRLMPLQRPEDAQAIQQAFNQCAKSTGGNNAECARRIAGSTAPLGGLAAGRGLLSGFFRCGR